MYIKQLLKQLNFTKVKAYINKSLYFKSMLILSIILIINKVGLYIVFNNDITPTFYSHYINIANFPLTVLTLKNTLSFSCHGSYLVTDF